MIVLNRYKNPETGTDEWLPTMLSGRTHWVDSQGMTMSKHGVTESAHSVVMIWFDVGAGGKTYIPPDAFAKLPPTTAKQYWTLAPAYDKLVKGDLDVMLPVDMNAITARHDCITIKGVDTLDFGSRRMRHWKVMGA